MTDFKATLIDFSNDLLDGVISDLTKENEEYKAFKNDERKTVDQFDEVLDRMAKEDRDFIKKHEMNVFNMIAIEQSYIYHRGFKDCIKLLKLMEII